MTGRQRIIAALKHQQTDKLPWAPLIDDYYLSSLPKQGLNLDYLEAMDYIGADVIERHVQGTQEVYKNGVIYREKVSSTKKIRIFETPVGTIYEERPIGISPFAVSSPFVKTYDDIKVYKYVAENTDYEITSEIFAQRDKEIGNLGIATLDGPMSPIMEILQYVCGVQNTIYFLADYEDEMAGLIRAMHERNLKHYKQLVKVPALVVIDYEDTSTTMMNKYMFHDLSVPCIEEYSRLVKDAGMIFITHMCGKLTGFLDIVTNLDVYGIDSVCPPTTGDLYPWDAKRAWKNNKVIIGGIEPPSLVFMNREQTLQCVQDIIVNMPSFEGFILSTGDATPHDTPIVNLIAITKFINILGNKVFTEKLDPSYLRQLAEGIVK